jgi:hypothetical protein
MPWFNHSLPSGLGARELQPFHFNFFKGTLMESSSSKRQRLLLSQQRAQQTVQGYLPPDTATQRAAPEPVTQQAQVPAASSASLGEGIAGGPSRKHRPAKYSPHRSSAPPAVQEGDYSPNFETESLATPLSIEQLQRQRIPQYIKNAVDKFQEYELKLLNPSANYVYLTEFVKNEVDLASQLVREHQERASELEGGGAALTHCTHYADTIERLFKTVETTDRPMVESSVTLADISKIEEALTWVLRNPDVANSLKNLSFACAYTTIRKIFIESLLEPQYQSPASVAEAIASIGDFFDSALAKENFASPHVFVAMPLMQRIEDAIAQQRYPEMMAFMNRAGQFHRIKKMRLDDIDLTVSRVTRWTVDFSAQGDTLHLKSLDSYGEPESSVDIEPPRFSQPIKEAIEVVADLVLRLQALAPNRQATQSDIERAQRICHHSLAAINKLNEAFQISGKRKIESELWKRSKIAGKGTIEVLPEMAVDLFRRAMDDSQTPETMGVAALTAAKLIALAIGCAKTKDWLGKTDTQKTVVDVLGVFRQEPYKDQFVDKVVNLLTNPDEDLIPADWA